LDGHRNCSVMMEPEDSKKHNKICPECKRPMTIGVLHRVMDLADREEDFKPQNRPPFRFVMPLHEILSTHLGKGIATKSVWQVYHEILKAGKNEYDILFNVSKDELVKVTTEEIISLIMKNRKGKIRVSPGYDGVYGSPVFDNSSEKNQINEKIIKKSYNIAAGAQKGLSDFF